MALSRWLPVCRALAYATLGSPFTASCVDSADSRKRNRSTAFDAHFDAVRQRAR